MVGTNLIIAIKEEGKSFDELTDTITIENWYNVNNRIEKIVFADGTRLDTSSAILSLSVTDGDDTITGMEQALTIDAKGGNDTITTNNGVANLIHGGEGNDSITTGIGADTLYGDAGDDIINSGDGNDTIDGGAGDDLLYTGLLGADKLTGGTGNDILEGGYHDDIYVFNKGDGQDIIYDGHWRRGSDNAITNNVYNSGNDTISFGAGIGAGDIAIYKSGTSLFLSYGDNDLININDQFITNNAIEKFTLSDGNFLTSNDLNVIIQSMNAYAADHEIIIDSIDVVKANQDLMNIIAALWHQ